MRSLLPPQGGAARTQAYRWLAFMASEIYPMVEISDYPERFVTNGDARGAASESARTHPRAAFDRGADVRRAVVSPVRFFIVDIYAAMFSRWRGSIGKEWLAEGHIPKLDNLATAVSKRPAIAPVWKRHFGDRS
ncbi:MAG: hypothetical protein WDM89_11165 [Rhizomicrobium sp.]